MASLISSSSVTVHNLSNGKTVTVEIPGDISSVTVSQFRDFVTQAGGFSFAINIQFISPNGRSMGKGNLGKYGVTSGSMIYANNNGTSSNGNWLAVRVYPNLTDSYENVRLPLDQDETIETLKLKAWAQCSIPAHDQEVLIKGITVETGMLSELCLTPDSIIEIKTKKSTVVENEVRVYRKWFYLGGSQTRPVEPSQWFEYDENVSFHLTRAHEEMLADNLKEGLMVDLSAFTNPPAPYQVWRGAPFTITNPRERPTSGIAVCGGRYGKQSVAGFDVDLWRGLSESELPQGVIPSVASVSAHIFYQVRCTHVKLLSDLTSYLQDSSGNSPLQLPKQVARRAVLMIYQPMGDAAPTSAPITESLEMGAAEELGNGSESVWQWWWGDARSATRGHWKSYHPHVCRNLERAWQQGQRILDVDASRYQLQQVSEGKPFDYIGQDGFREPFMPRDVLTVDSEIFANTRAIGECFVQFHRSNPHRRRAARRVVPQGHAAAHPASTDEENPCSICFSEVGSSLGCAHFACDSCLRRCIRIFTADSTKTTNLVCGCYSSTNRTDLDCFARRADSSLQTLLRMDAPAGGPEQAEYEDEISQAKEWSGVETSDAIPMDAHHSKVHQWLNLLEARSLEELFIVCSFPECPMENWILKSDFEAQRDHGICTWRCQAGHDNTVLPTPSEIDEMNRNLLSHPEFYTQNCSYDSQALRRYRLCNECVALGKLVLAVHGGACKQWPGGGANVRTHPHCFCFKCCGRWGVDCRHQVTCTDPGVQQVRVVKSGGVDRLEMGYINSQRYMKALTSNQAFPDTVFPTGMLNGEERQRALGMMDRKALAAEMRRGTA